MKFEGLGSSEEDTRRDDDSNPNFGDRADGEASVGSGPQELEDTGQRADSVSDPGSIDTFEGEGGLMPPGQV